MMRETVYCMYRKHLYLYSGKTLNSASSIKITLIYMSYEANAVLQHSLLMQKEPLSYTRFFKS